MKNKLLEFSILMKSISYCGKTTHLHVVALICSMKMMWMFQCFSHRFFIDFSCFFMFMLRLDFGITFCSHFWWKKAPKWPPKSIPEPTFATKMARKWHNPELQKHPRAELFSGIDFSIPFGTLLAHFWCPLAQLWCPWDHFCSPLRSMFTLSRFPDVMFNIFWNLRWVSYVSSYLFEKYSLKCSLFTMFLIFCSAAKQPKTIPGTRTPPSFGPGAETCRKQPLF